LDEEREWRMKIRALWLEVGDQNMKYFQNYENHWKNFNTLWDLVDEVGNKVKGFKNIANFGINHFGNLFMELEHEDIGFMLKVLENFPIFVEDDENVDLLWPVSMDRLLGIINYFQKYKILGLDGWTMKLFVNFFSTVGTDLLRVVE
jgi:hypothetical protein